MCQSDNSCYLVLNVSESCSRRNARSDLNGYVVSCSAGCQLMCFSLRKEAPAQVIVFRILLSMLVVTGSALRGVDLMTANFYAVALNVVSE